VSSFACLAAARNTAFAFSGCAPISSESVRELSAAEPTFMRALCACDDAISGELGWSFADTLLAIPRGATVIDLPTNFPLGVALQLSMLAVIRHYGLEPTAVVGMSAGELTSAYAAGVLSLRDTLRIAVHGGRLMNAQASGLRMVIVWLCARECEEQLANYGHLLSVAGTMEAGVTVVSGVSSAIAELQHSLSLRGTRCHSLPFPWGVHTPALTEGREAFERVMQSVEVHPPVRPIMSTLLGRWAGVGDDFTLRHWWDLFSAPVQFVAPIHAMIRTVGDRFIDIGPDASLSHLVARLGGRALPFMEALAGAKVCS
jgi:acyl transferase domain-containing protein